jgi:hypothetical protein
VQTSRDVIPRKAARRSQSSPRRATAEHQRLRAIADAEPRIKGWRAGYVKGVLLLRKGGVFRAAEGVFNQALTNGLLAIACVEQPALVAVERLPSASQLAKDLAHVPEVDQPKLDQAIKRTDAARHGRDVGSQLKEGDIRLLGELDGHPALSVILGEQIDERWANAYLVNRHEIERAVAYLELLDDDEVQRRIEFAESALAPTPGEYDEGPQECDVCENETMNREGRDDFGYGYVLGTCVVCSYRRSDDVAHQSGMDAEMRRQMEKDD